MGKLDGRVALVTGAAQGIGAVYAKALAAEGAKLVIADILDGSATADKINNAGGVAMSVHADVSDAKSVEIMLAAAVDRFGGVDILVSNAAVYASLELQPLTEIDLDEWDKVMAVNVRGAFLCARAVIPVMRKQGYGRIINIASGTPYKGTPFLLHYVTSKGAIIAMSRAISREVGNDGICVNTLSPGFVLSEGVIANKDLREKLSAPVLASRAIKRDQFPEDLIGPLVFLASDDCEFMTGQSVVVDGGSVNN